MEDYEKLYKQALENAKRLYEQGTITESLAYIFPELKESEDEKIRVSIIDHLKDNNLIEWAAWLEKQESVREVVERCKNSWYNEGKIAGMAEGLTNDEKYQQGWHDALEKQCQTFTKKDVDDAYLKGICDTKHELEKQGEQKPTVVDFNAKDWYVSKVDGKLHNIYQSVDKIEQKPTSDTRYEVKNGDSLSVNGKPFDYEKATITQKDFAQKPIEWSDKDEEMFQNCTGAIWAADYYLYEDKQEMEAWLKRLKDRIGG